MVAEVFLKNYTSNVPVSETTYNIEKVLIRCGVSGIMKEYAGINGEVAAITFRIETATGPLTIRLPVDKQKAIDALWADYVGDDKMDDSKTRVAYNRKKKKRRSDFVDQGCRTAWKIMQDWVEVQLSMIQMKQADTLQVFLPYVYDGKRTYYQALQQNNFRGLLPEKCDDSK